MRDTDRAVIAALLVSAFAMALLELIDGRQPTKRVLLIPAIAMAPVVIAGRFYPELAIPVATSIVGNALGHWIFSAREQPPEKPVPPVNAPMWS